MWCAAGEVRDVAIVMAGWAGQPCRACFVLQCIDVAMFVVVFVVWYLSSGTLRLACGVGYLTSGS